jgi:hypothetical protein
MATGAPGYGQTRPAHDSSGSRGHWADLVWVARIPPRDRVQSLRMGANDKIVQRILRHANPHVTKERYIKAFDPAVLEAMQRMQATLEMLEKSQAVVRQMN